MQSFRDVFGHFCVMLLSAMLLILSGCDQHKDRRSSSLNSNMTLKRAFYLDEMVFDPHFITTHEQSAPICDLLVGLMAFNQKGEIVAGVAQEWRTENNQQWQFVLDKTAKWSNSQAVTAGDFVASWQRLINPRNASPLANYLVYMGVENAKDILRGDKAVEDLGVIALDDHTLLIRLEKANSQLVKMLAHIALLPTYHGQVPKAEHFISNGAYRLDHFTDIKISLKAVEKTLPFTEVEYHKINELQAIRQFDIIENPLVSQEHNIWQFPRLCTYFYEFNFADLQLKKKEIRQVIKSMVLSARVPQKYGIASFSVLPKSMRTTRATPWQPILIEQLLQQADISEHNPFKINLLYDEQSKHSVIADQVIRALSQSDLIQVSPVGVTWDDLLHRRNLGDFQMSRAGWCADYPDALQFIEHFHSQSPDNKTNYHNVVVDQSLEKLQLDNLSEQQRQQLIEKVVEQIDNDIAILPMFQYYRRVAIDPTVLGIDLNNNSEVIYSKHLYRIKPKD
ncbi:peptide transporter [[Haemophilus] ducreyi]|uniref:Oligopeptide transporter, periplasmic-binding protein n=2 Tax=Haemophilus ducreyi TaxID=730 RepID=Q7VKX6_HAEDU|nr:peptide ABC transporter substrate-binding protein [[Haemophilus] ducreyi]AAP96491.1 putative oligopeptide transporter, periplasmic-binding protein [[Haemophilus] ducreyi 35000HP]AKO31351.1 peptide transporter [[Haemophilus] ducreyi]AKO32802.1 peptide transporter [[Haemophilus] ducreyi]AKO34251.1 peptide transporter [[Haemophilus] ducreyi]AKO35694.1 peptide transporter [[Haemophilus] ducreyi]